MRATNIDPEVANNMKLPLTYADIVDEIVEFTSLSREEVEQRVWMEALHPGSNVLRDASRFGITPHVSNEKMRQLYEQGDGFIFETLVFWAKPERYVWTEQAHERIRCYAAQRNVPAENISILIFGDGAGNDSLYLASKGFKVDYFDVPGSKTFEFAMKRIEKYGFLGRSVRALPDYRSCFKQEYDVVISFEVLEHIPEPLTLIRDMASVLKTGGIALITEDFGDIVREVPTHLKATSRYMGQTPFLFLKHNMLLSWYGRQPLFKPMEFVHVSKISIADRFSLFRDFNVRSAFLARYSIKLARFIEKLAYLRVWNI
jgi:2-polyprenyl-3-methyl-5-hydroxy-6-metoxy-1,4-benzoquinol methylase